jgi:DNA polymerase-3 subunit gamma/tau
VRAETRIATPVAPTQAAAQKQDVAIEPVRASARATSTPVRNPEVKTEGPSEVTTPEPPTRAIEPVAAAAAPAAEGIDGWRQAVCAALDQAGHASAAQLLGAGTWTLDGAQLRIETAAMGKKMLSLTVNAAAEKIVREALTRAGGPSRHLIVPGETGGTAQAVMTMAARGSIQEAALNHPMVQRAKEIMKAEVRSVVDLREDSRNAR